MTIRHASSCLATLFLSLAALSISGCDDNGVETAVGPSGLDTNARFVNRAVSVPQSNVVAVASPAFFCPAFPPFSVPFNLVVRAGTSDLFLRQVRMQFTDSLGVLGGFRTIIGNELGVLFGSPRIPSFGARTFPLSLPFGCVGGQTGVVTTLVVVADETGRESTTSVNVSVR